MNNLRGGKGAFDLICSVSKVRGRLRMPSHCTMRVLEKLAVGGKRLVALGAPESGSHRRGRANVGE